MGPPVFCAQPQPEHRRLPGLGLCAGVFVELAADNHPAMGNFQPPSIYDPYDEERFEERASLISRSFESAPGSTGTSA